MKLNNLKSLHKFLQHKSLKSITFLLIFSIFVSCTPPNSESPNSTEKIITQEDLEWTEYITKNYSILDEKVYEGDYDWIKFFILDNQLKFFQSDKSKPSDIHQKTYEELKKEIPNGTSGTVVAINSSKNIPEGGKMILLKTDSHQNYSSGCCYENNSIGEEVHSNCFIPMYLSVMSKCVIQACYYSENIKNEGATGTACFYNYQTAINNLNYNADIYSYKPTYAEFNK